MPDVIALVDDLIFQARIAETARRAGVELATVTSADALVAAAAQSPAALLIVDLNARGAPLEALERLGRAAPRRRVVAFVSHVQVELAERARAAGCSEVLPRSKFTQVLPDLLLSART